MKKVKVFLSYSHKNSHEFAEVRDTLQSIKNIEYWDDTQLMVGDKWDEKIKEYLTKADIGVLLVTTPFLNSKYINKIEVKQLLQQCNAGKTKIFIVILRQCAWHEIEWIGEYELFNKGTPIWEKNGTRSKRESHLTKLAYDLSELVKEIQNTADGRRSSKLSRKLPSQNNGDLPFTNQASIIKVLKPPENLAKNTFTYATLTGLAGQGKSYLLKELKKMYLQKKWVCGYAMFDPEKGDIEFTKELLNDLGISVKDFRGNKNLGAEFYRQYIKKKQGWKKPLALFIDTLGTASKNDVMILDNNFVDDLDKLITANKYFNNSGRYRLFFAGRNLSGDLIDAQKPEKYVNQKLSPFRYEDVIKMLDRYKVFSDLSSEAKADLAADMLYLSGGHPGLMSKIVKKYKNEQLSPQDFIDLYIKNYWENDLAVTMNDISHGLFNKKEKVKEFAEKTVAFRYFNKSVIRKLYNGVSPEKVASVTINTSGLYRDDNPEYPNLYSDGVLRDIHALHILANNPENIKSKCVESRSLCWDEILSSINAKEFMVEYLFQCLQESIAESKNRIHRQRKSIRRNFEKKAEEFVVKLSKVRRDRTRKEEIGREFIGALKSHTDLDDGDKNRALFRFWIIYIYKDESYNIDVYNNFVSTIEKLVKKHFGRRKK